MEGCIGQRLGWADGGLSGVGSKDSECPEAAFGRIVSHVHCLQNHDQSAVIPVMHANNASHVPYLKLLSRVHSIPRGSDGHRPSSTKPVWSCCPPDCAE
jgi:hypothetical protein